MRPPATSPSPAPNTANRKISPTTFIRSLAVRVSSGTNASSAPLDIVAAVKNSSSISTKYSAFHQLLPATGRNQISAPNRA